MLASIALFGLVAWAEEPPRVGCPPVAVESGDAPVDRMQRVLVERIARGDGDGVYALWSAAMRQAVPLEETRLFVEGLLETRGCLVTSERTVSGDVQGTWRIVAQRGEWQMRLTTDAAGEQVLGLQFEDPPTAAPPVAQMRGLALPVEGAWLVYWGGDTREENHHMDFPSQRRAADLVRVDAQGRSCTGARFEDCLAYGQPVCAVADGTVVTAIDGVPDSVLGVLNPYSAIGNAVFVQHPGGLYSVYAHLKPGSVRVKVGKPVRQGQMVGLVGNSGNSSEPHLHFQVQDGPRFESSWGVEAVFDEVVLTRGGFTSPSPTYVLRQGDVVAPIEP